MKEIRPLTSMRGLFALWVLLFHLRHAMPTAWRILGRGYLGVDFFFLLSGFVLAGSYGQKFLSVRERREYWLFLIMRWGRLFPLHLTIITVILVVELSSGAPHVPIGQVFREATLTQAWNVFEAGHLPINGPAWSISLEWAANLLFPVFVAVTLGRSSGLAICACALSLATLVYVASLHGWSVDLTGPTTFRETLRCFSEFSLGLLAYRYRACSAVLRSDLMLAALLAAAVGAVIAQANDLILIAIMIPLLIAAAVNSTRMKVILSFRPLYFLGTISYSIYLIQYPIINLFEKYTIHISNGPNENIIIFVGSILTTIVLSVVTYKTIEVPARDGVKKLVKPFRGRPDLS